MRRREFIQLLGGAATAPWLAPHAARAQDQVRRIGALFALAEGDPEGQRRVSAFQQGLQQLGWKIGSNVKIDYRWAAGDDGRLRTYAAELVAQKPDVILAATNSSLAALRRETRSIPIVFTQTIDPVAAGYVASLARPGGNITGFAMYEHGLAVKWLELLKQIAPGVTRVAVIYNPVAPTAAGHLREIAAGAPSFGFEVSALAMRDRTEIERAIDAFAREPNGGLIVLPNPLAAIHRDFIISLAARHRLPNVYSLRYWPTSGGLASYGVDNIDLYRRATSYVDRILKGDKPGDLPVQQATKFELVINLKTAKALGLDIPMTLLARTDEVIE